LSLVMVVVVVVVVVAAAAAAAAVVELPLVMVVRVTTCLENPEMSGNLKHVTEISGMLLTVREMPGKKILSWKSVPKLFITR